MRWLWRAFAIVLALASAVEGQALSSPSEDWVRLRSNGNEFSARRTAPVSYRSLDALTAALEHPLQGRSRVIRLVRASPPETIEYTVCVMSDGTLVFGEQTFTLDPATGRHVLIKHGLTRAYPALEYLRRWVWLVELPLSREVTVTLEIRAAGAGWPVRSVTIDVSRDQ